MRRALAWIIVVALVLGGAYLGDNWLRGYVENRAAEAISAEFGEAAGAPSVGLGGFPFALALLTRSVPEARLTIDALPLEISGHQVELADVAARTGEIRVSDSTVDVTSLTGTATLAYADLAKIAGVPVEYSGDGRLELRYTRELFGRELTFAVSALPEMDVSEQVVRLTDPKLDLAGNNIDVGLSQAQLDAIVEPISVQLDHGLRLTSITAEEPGVRIGVDGQDLSVPVP
ncbi:MAG: DUF2993 domain-containing protein [Propionibacteriaceae bacterium]|nr:DUF2993 domain-containing protein [Propionibacteriaceae bacterium]